MLFDPISMAAEAKPDDLHGFRLQSLDTFHIQPNTSTTSLTMKQNIMNQTAASEQVKTKRSNVRVSSLLSNQKHERNLKWEQRSKGDCEMTVW